MKFKVGEKVGELIVLSQLFDIACYTVKEETGNVFVITEEVLERHRNDCCTKRFRDLYMKPPTVDSLNSYTGIYETPISLNKPLNQTPKKMTRLTTHENWTICLNENKKLVAFDDAGNTITAVGSLLSVGGYAFQYTNGLLYKGLLNLIRTEEQIKKDAEEDRQAKIFAKYQLKFDRNRKQNEKLYCAREKELQNG